MQQSRLLHLCSIRTWELVSRYDRPQCYEISNMFFGALYRFVIAEREGVFGELCGLYLAMGTNRDVGTRVSTSTRARESTKDMAILGTRNTARIGTRNSIYWIR